jgi:hypothetical protein
MDIGCPLPPGGVGRIGPPRMESGAVRGGALPGNAGSWRPQGGRARASLILQ